MGQATSELLHARQVQIHAAAATLPTPTGAPADQVTTWRQGPLALRSLLLKILGHAGAVTLTGPVYAVGYHDKDAVWYRFALLNGGADVVIGLAIGWIFKLIDMPAWASAVKLEATGGVSAAVDAWIEPLETEGVP